MATIKPKTLCYIVHYQENRTHWNTDGIDRVQSCHLIHYCLLIRAHGITLKLVIVTNQMRQYAMSPI